MRQSDCVAGVLIGGLSSRMGACKAMVRLGGRAFADRVADAAAEVLDDVVWLGEIDGRAGLSHRPTLPDAPFGSGPLRGLYSLLQFSRHPWGLLLACDVPLVSGDLLGRLLAARSNHWDAVAFSRENGVDFHSCCALYNRRALPAVEAELRRGRGRLQRVLQVLPCRRLQPTESERRQLINVNTPAILREIVMQRAISGTDAERLWAEAAS